ncbi:uncharacterized protein G2W53_022839 [Senna tora]|uniref:Uncharacterized protein n=1 Tax=Senna tora TaxID=362788 RepID=A0A834TQE3_9FABA|nr:uncharacterized protein G2W53_022839 [Senna tora]
MREGGGLVGIGVFRRKGRGGGG